MDEDLQSKIINYANQFRIPLALCLLGVVLILGGMAFSQNREKEPADFPKESIVESQKEISIDVSGAVKNPGVYKLNSFSRVEDAIKAAGGLTEKANKEYISKYLNLAQKISDGVKIYVPFEGESAPALYQTVTGPAGPGTKLSSQVNINSATQPELEALPGIGPVSAAKIISGRPYQKPEDLLNQKIVSKSTFEKIKDLISI